MTEQWLVETARLFSVSESMRQQKPNTYPNETVETREKSGNIFAPHT